jgi:hypothetical protein
LRVHHLMLQDTLKERRSGKDILVSGEDPLLLTDYESDDGRDGVPRPEPISTECTRWGDA